MKRILLLAVLFLLSMQSYADNFYINLGAGGFISNSNSSYAADSTSSLYAPTAVGTSLFFLPNVNWKNSFNNGFNLNVATGYHFTPYYRAETEFLYQNLTRDISGSYEWREIATTTQQIYARSAGNPITSASSNVNLYSFLTNFLYDFKNNSKWTPFVGGGIGLAWINSSGTTRSGILNVDDPVTPLKETAPVSQQSPDLYGTAFAWQFKMGVSYAWDDKKTVALNYRLFGTSQFKAGNSSIVSNPNTPYATTFNVAAHDISGILTNALEISMRFDI